jgi:hypothetical protein
MFKEIQKTIEQFSGDNIPLERKHILQALIEYIQSKININD